MKPEVVEPALGLPTPTSIPERQAFTSSFFFFITE